jgi:hypothetical protein
MDRIENDASKNSYIIPCVFVVAVTFLSSRCLATKGKCLPSYCLGMARGYTYTHTQTDGSG